MSKRNSVQIVDGLPRYLKNGIQNTYTRTKSINSTFIASSLTFSIEIAGIFILTLYTHNKADLCNVLVLWDRVDQTITLCMLLSFIGPETGHNKLNTVNL